MDEALCVRCEKIVRLSEPMVLIVAVLPKPMIICEACA